MTDAPDGQDKPSDRPAPDIEVRGSVRGNLLVAGRDLIVNWVGHVPAWALFAISISAVAAVLGLGLTARVTVFAPTPTPIIIPTPVPPTAVPTPIPTPVSVSGHNIGIIVSYFVVPEDGSVDVAKSRGIVDDFYVHMQAELLSAKDRFGVDLGIAGPNEVGQVTGQTREERKTSAQTLSGIHNADIVVYGVIARSDNNLLQIEPEIWVNPDRFADHLEITGPERMGDEIELRGSSDDFSNIVEANQPLQGRITALAYISAGLSQYVADDYEGALELFEQAQSVSQWTDDQGREVVYVLLGNAHLRLASEGAFHGDADTVEEQVALARADYETANGLAEAYSRPYAGLASAYYLAAMAPTYRGEYPDFALLDEAMVQVEQADDALDQPQDIGVNSRWLFTRAQVQFQRWLYGLDFYTDEELGAFYADFDRVSQQIITDYGQGTNPSLSLLASESHIFRGLAFQTNGQCRDALDAYDAALGFELALNRRMFVLGWKGDCHQKRGEQDQATVAYEQALDLAEGLGFDVDANCYQMKLDNIEEEVRCG